MTTANHNTNRKNNTAVPEPNSKMAAAADAHQGVRLGRVVRREGERVVVHSGEDELTVAVAASVEDALVDACLAERRYVVVVERPTPTLVGALQSRSEGRGEDSARASLCAQQSVTLRAGKAAIVLHADGTIELTGTQIRLSGQENVDLQGGSVTLP